MEKKLTIEDFVKREKFAININWKKLLIPKDPFEKTNLSGYEEDSRIVMDVFEDLTRKGLMSKNSFRAGDYFIGSEGITVEILGAGQRILESATYFPRRVTDAIELCRIKYAGAIYPVAVLQIVGICNERGTGGTSDDSSYI